MPSVHRSIALIAFIACAFAKRASPQSGRPLAIEDYYKMRNVGSPVMSPEGRWVAFDVSTRVEQTNGTDNEIWLVPTDGSADAKRVSPAGANAITPMWMEDGRLRFTAGGRFLAVDPSHPEMIDSSGTLSVVTQGRSGRGGRGGAGGGRGGRGNAAPVTSPDGQWIATVRGVPFDRKPQRDLTDFEKRHLGYFKGVQFDYLPFHQDGGPFPLPNRNDPEVNAPQDIFLGGRGGDAERRITQLGLRPTGVEWSADGSELVFVADSLYRNELANGRPEVWLVRMPSATLVRLTPNKEYRYAGAQPSPDGKWILTTRKITDDEIIAKKWNHGSPTDLVLIPTSGQGAEINLTSQWDDIPAGAFWSPDGKYVYFTGEIGGTTHLLRVAADPKRWCAGCPGAPVEQVTTGQRRLAAFSYDKAFTKTAYTVALFEKPNEIYVANVDGSGEKQLTHVSDAFLREVSLSKTDRLQFKSADGTPVEGWITYPFGYKPGGGPYPLIVTSHGGPHSADGYGFNFKDQYLAANGYFVLQVNFRSSTGYGENFLWATWGAWGAKDGQDVMAGVDYAIGKYPIDRNRMGAMGHSYGGFMTNWLITHYPDRFKGAATGAGIANWTSDYGNSDIPITKEEEFWGGPWDAKALETMIRQSPLMMANRVKAATLFIVGEVDQRVPYSETQQMYVAVKKQGVPAKVIQYAGMPHGITGNWNNVHRMLNERWWMDEYVKNAMSGR